MILMSLEITCKSLNIANYQTVVSWIFGRTEIKPFVSYSSDHEWNPGNFDELHDYLEFVTVANGK